MSNAILSTSDLLKDAGISDLSKPAQAALDATIQNETSHVTRKGFSLQRAPTGQSGWSIGPIQFDLKGDSVEARAVPDQVKSYAS